MIVIGYTKGIGKAIYDTLECSGVGISEGCDISIPRQRIDLVTQCVSHDVIILNAFDTKNRNAQLETFFELYKAFKDLDKTIIVIGSCSQDSWRDTDGEYQSYKAAIDYATANASRHRNKCKIVNIRLGHTATKSNLKPKRKNKSIDPFSVPELIKSILSMPKDMLVTEVTVLPSRQGVTDAII